MNNTHKKLLIICSLIMAAWIAVILLKVDISSAGFYIWAGVIGSVIAFIVMCLAMYFWDCGNSRDTAEIDMLPFFVSLFYFVAALIFNSIFIAIADDDYSKAIPVAVNAVLLIIFIGYYMFLGTYKERVAKTAAHTADKVHNVGEISYQLAGILGSAKDDKVRSRLHSLKEKVDYSTNVSQPFTVDVENRFRDQLSDISKAIIKNETPEEILPLIDAAEQTWERRNSFSSSVR